MQTDEQFIINPILLQVKYIQSKLNSFHCDNMNKIMTTDITIFLIYFMLTTRTLKEKNFENKNPFCKTASTK